MTDEKFMEMAIALAKKGMGRVNPNPMVGAVIVKEGKLIGQGFHEKYGGPHAERNALKSCKENPEGPVLYVTLEPCCHYGKTPPCTEAIIKSGIKKVVTACPDPNPEVAGKGIEALRAAGIEVVTGILGKEGEKLNEVFFHCIQTNTPFVVMKYAMTMDGKIAAACEAAVVELAGKAGQAKTIIATSCKDKEKQEKYKRCGCEIIVLPKENGHIDLRLLMLRLLPCPSTMRILLRAYPQRKGALLPLRSWGRKQNRRTFAIPVICFPFWLKKTAYWTGVGIPRQRWI